MSMLLNSPASMVVLLVTAASSNNDAPNLVTFYGPNGSLDIVKKAKTLFGPWAGLSGT